MKSGHVFDPLLTERVGVSQVGSVRTATVGVNPRRIHAVPYQGDAVRQRRIARAPFNIVGELRSVRTTVERRVHHYYFLAVEKVLFMLPMFLYFANEVLGFSFSSTWV